MHGTFINIIEYVSVLCWLKREKLKGGSAENN